MKPTIQVRKMAGERYDKPHSPKLYEVTRDGQPVGMLEQTVDLSRWAVRDVWGCEVSRHATIKAAARVAGKVLQ